MGRARLESFHLHDLRHTFASKLAMRGVSLQAVKESSLTNGALVIAAPAA